METRAPHSSSPICRKNRLSSGACPTISKLCKNAWAPAVCPSRSFSVWRSAAKVRKGSNPWNRAKVPTPQSAAAVKLPFGAVEQAYAERIHFTDLHLSRSTNMIKQEFTYVTGTMANDGVATIRAMEVTVEFRDGLNQVILRDSQFVIAPQADPPLNAGLSREFQATLEHVPAEWNQEYPSIRVSGLVLQ